MATKAKEPAADANIYATPDDHAIAALEAQQKMMDKMSGVVSRLSQIARTRVSARSPIELRWFDDLRLYHGRFDAKTEEALRLTPEKSRAIINMVRPKTKAWNARLADLLFPADDKNWGINPTPVPELTEKAKAAAAAADAKHAEAERMVDIHNRDQAAGTTTPIPTGEHPLEAAARLGTEALDLSQAEAEANSVMQAAKRCAENMAHEIDDQLTECSYPRQARNAIADMCKLGVGVLKGPLNGKAANRWRKVTKILNEGEANERTAEVFDLAPTSDGNRPIAVHVDPWAFFPDENAVDMESSESELERHLPNKSQLRRLAKELSFFEPAVEELLKEGPGYGTTEDLNYLTQLRSITDEGNAVTDRYVLWEYHGPLECEEVELLMSVLEGNEAAAKWKADYSELDEVRVIVWFCGGKLLKIEPDWLLDTNETLYSVVSFEKSESSVLGGYGVPAMMRDPERALRAAWRMLMDNSGLSVGPQILIDKSRVQPENGDWKLEARKVWLVTGEDITPNSPAPFQTFDIPSNTDELIKTIELALKFIDETTSLPLIAQGEQGAHITQTAGGMSMLMNSANVIFRNVVKNFDDDMTAPLIRRFYDWNMQFNPKEEIKGDMQIEARGTSALLVREVQSANLMAMVERWSGHPVIGMALKVYDALRMAVQSLSINPDDVLGTRDEFEAKMKAQAENPPADPRIEAAQIDYKSRGEQNAANIEIANIRLKASIADVQARTGETSEKIAADLKKATDDIQHKERMKAVDVAVEDQRAAEARSEGESESSATGKGVG